jgi:hypothetical protein
MPAVSLSVLRPRRDERGREVLRPFLIDGLHAGQRIAHDVAGGVAFALCHQPPQVATFLRQLIALPAVAGQQVIPQRQPGQHHLQLHRLQRLHALKRDGPQAVDGTLAEHDAGVDDEQDQDDRDDRSESVVESLADSHDVFTLVR